MKKTILQIIGYTAVALGFAGAFLPLVPTTPFLLLALYCFSRSSPRMNDWLLRNRLFGRYLKDYEQGRGIPLAVKVSTLIMLWSSILFTTIVFVRHWWLGAGLLTMALVVSLHIARIKTKLTGSKILVLFPTAMEAAAFTPQEAERVAVEIIGVGPYRSALNTYKQLLHHRPRMVILAGIAGAYPAGGLQVGDTVLVGAETAADMGSFVDGAFRPKFSERIECPHIPSDTRFRRVESNSLSAAAAPFVDQSGAGIENMEGGSFFYACTQAETPFLELRTISNRVGDDFRHWDIEGATTRLGEALKELIDELEA